MLSNPGGFPPAVIAGVCRAGVSVMVFSACSLLMLNEKCDRAGLAGLSGVCLGIVIISLR